MKTAEEWAKRIQNSKEPWPKLVELIQRDAMIAAYERAEKICFDVQTQRMIDHKYADGALDCQLTITAEIERVKKGNQ